jgi:hypothetical protein
MPTPSDTTYGNDPLPYDGQQLAMTEVAGLFQKTDDRLNRHVIKTGTLGADYTLTADDLKCGVLELAWVLTANVVVKIPVTGESQGTRRSLKIYNNTTGSFTVTVKTTDAGSTGTTVAKGYIREVWHNELHVHPAGHEIPVAASSLSSGVVAFWKLGEASGTRSDSVGSNHLTDNNTVTQAAGKVGNAASFASASSEYLSVADNADLSTGDVDFTFAGWFYLTTKTVAMDLFAKWGASGQFEYILTYDQTTDRFIFFVSNNGTATVPVTASTFGSPSTAPWYFIVVYHDAAGNLIGISVNNGAFNTAAHTTGVFNSTAPFQIGGRASSPMYLNGRGDAVGFWKRLLTAPEITELYNGGSGKEYPF